MIIFDLDGTISDCEHRRHFVDIDAALKKGYIPAVEAFGDKITNEQRGGVYHKETKEKWKPDWHSFHQNCSEDTPIWPVITTIEALTFKEKDIQIWSGRCESVRGRTVHWLKYIIGDSTYSVLKMRPIGDSTPDDSLKEKWLNEALKEGKTVDFVFDDRPKVIRMWRRRGIFVFNCCQHDEEF